MIPRHVLDAVAPHAHVVSAVRVGGGCISPAARVETTAGPRFLKWAGDRQADGLFQSEADGLRALAAAGPVRVPRVEAIGSDWILTEWLEPGPATQATWEAFGAALARLHRVQSDDFGWSSPNFIGSLPQSNRRNAQWPGFWRAERIEPQLALAFGRGHFSSAERRMLDDYVSAIDDLLAAGDAEGPSLLHGDLWGGNAHASTEGIALIDPAVYYGHREVDLAMAALFGGFPRAFHASYAREWPLRPGFEQRCAAYQVYYLLVHVNLFGEGYVPGVMERVKLART